MPRFFGKELFEPQSSQLTQRKHFSQFKPPLSVISVSSVVKQKFIEH